MRRLTTVLAAGLTAAMALDPTLAWAGPYLAPGEPRSSAPDKQEEATMTNHAYVGMWVTGDGYIRHELLPNGRYDEARGSRKSAYQGGYTVTGHHIDYVDDTGFTADGEFIDGVLHHAGMILYRER